MKDAISAQKALQRSKTETSELLEETKDINDLLVKKQTGKIVLVSTPVEDYAFSIGWGRAHVACGELKRHYLAASSVPSRSCKEKSHT